MTFIVDENVSLSVHEKLVERGHKTILIASKKYSGWDDEDIFRLAVKEKAFIITRDYHFTNSMKYLPEKMAGILYIRVGNLSSEDEADLVENFMNNVELSDVRGKLVTLYRDGIKIRPS